MIDFGTALASILAKGLGIKLEFIDKSTGKTKVTRKGGNGPVIKQKGRNNLIIMPVVNGSLSPETKPLTEALNKAFDNKGINYLAAPAREKLSEYHQYESTIDRSRIITTLSGIIPYRHIALIKTGLYLRMLSDDNKQNEVNKIYAGLVNYSAEERYIINLASARHFNHYILPTFNELKGVNDGLNKFLDHYYKIVNDPELALFVHRGMSAENVYRSVIEMAQKNLKYGVVRHKIYVHATGISNVETLSEAYPRIKKIFPLSVKKRLARDMPNLTIKIPYQTNALDKQN